MTQPPTINPTAQAVTLPDVAEGEEVLLVEWLVQPGQAVAAEQPVAAIETGKATFDLTAERAGTIAGLAVAAGAILQPGDTLYHLVPAA